MNSSRLHFADLLRGLLMIHMAFDHASLFWNADRFADEFWSSLPAHPPPVDLANFIARFSGFPVAPGFAFMAGFMVAVTDAARAARGDSEASVRRRLLTRAGLLITLELVCFSWAMGRLEFGVLTMLGSCLAITTFVRRAPLKALTGASIAILALHPLLVPLWTDRLDAAGVTIKLLHQAGRFPGLDVYYPLIPWIGIMLLGVVTGRLYVGRGARGWGLAAGIFGVAFLLTRFTGLGAAAGFDAVLSYAFFTWAKYPPDLPWLSASFAVLFATLAILERLQHHPLLRSAIAEAVATFGRVPLFFYVLHFAALWITRPREPRHLAAAFAVWGVLLVAMWWPCRLWHGARIRKRRPALPADGTTGPEGGI